MTSDRKKPGVAFWATVVMVVVSRIHVPVLPAPIAIGFALLGYSALLP
jgi:hypothetical protein